MGRDLQRPKEGGVINRCTVHKVGRRAHPNAKLRLKKTNQTRLLSYLRRKLKVNHCALGLSIGYVANESNCVGCLTIIDVTL